MSNKVVITGMGAISPIGLTAEESFDAAIKGVCGIDSPTQFDSEITEIYASGEIKNFDPTQYISKREARKIARFSQFAIVAAMQAWAQSGMKEGDFDPDRVGVIIGSGMGCLGEICNQHSEMLSNPRAVSPMFIPKAIINTAAGQIAIKLGLHGPCFSVVTACATGTDALGQAYYAVKEGRMDAVVVGGAEAATIDLAVRGFHQMQALSQQKDPKKASRPFDKDRDGFVMSEGAAVMVIESEAHAKKRGALNYGEFAGFGQTCDAYHITAPHPEGIYAAKAMVNAIAEAGITKEDIGYINAHGTSTQLNDERENAAIENCFGSHAKKLLVSSTKSMTGHMLGGAGAFEAVMTVYALNNGIAPPTIGLSQECETCRLDYVKGKAKKMNAVYGMSNSFGFGGHNSTIVIKKREGQE